jgi:hypothetical protein
MRTMLFGIGAIDRFCIRDRGGLLFAALLACYLPARRVAAGKPQWMRSAESKTRFRGTSEFYAKELIFSLASTGLANNQRDGQDCSDAR